MRPLTGLGRRGAPAADPEWDRQRLALYRQGRDTLRAAGYGQLSMRQFRRADCRATDAPTTDCQDDGMVGLGCGARSYTAGLHYSFDYAVSVSGVRAVLDDYLRPPPGDFAYAEVGFAPGRGRAAPAVAGQVAAAGRGRARGRVAADGSAYRCRPLTRSSRPRGWLAVEPDRVG